MREFNFDFDEDKDPGRRPYIRVCKKCGKSFCSSDPSTNFHSGCKPKPKKYIYPKEFQIGRHIAWARDQQTCQLCGFDFREGGKDVCKHVHHIDQDTFNNDINNLVVLCAKCHRRVHSKKLEGKFDFKKDFTPKKYEKNILKVKKVYFKGVVKNSKRGRPKKKKKLFGIFG